MQTIFDSFTSVDVNLDFLCIWDNHFQLLDLYLVFPFNKTLPECKHDMTATRELANTDLARLESVWFHLMLTTLYSTPPFEGCHSNETSWSIYLPSKCLILSLIKIVLLRLRLITRSKMRPNYAIKRRRAVAQWLNQWDTGGEAAVIHLLTSNLPSICSPPIRPSILPRMLMLLPPLQT